MVVPKLVGSQMLTFMGCVWVTVSSVGDCQVAYVKWFSHMCIRNVKMPGCGVLVADSAGNACCGCWEGAVM